MKHKVGCKQSTNNRFLASMLAIGTSAILWSPIAQSTKTVEQAALSTLLYYPEYIFPAEIVAHTQSQISSELNAQLISIAVRPGQTVEKGSLLAMLDCRDTQDQLARNGHQQVEAKAKLTLANLQLKRFKNLESRQYSAASQSDESRSEVASLEASIAGLKVAEETAKRAVQRCQINAPFKAVVTELMAGDGQFLATGSPVLKLTRVDLAEIKTNVPYQLATGLQGKTAKWVAPGFEETSVNWLRQSDVLQSNQRMAQVWYAAPNNQPIGLAGNLVFNDSKPYIPAAYLVMRQQQLGVFTLDNNKAKFRAIPNVTVGRPAPLPKGWSVDMKIIVKGQQRLQDGEAL